MHNSDRKLSDLFLGSSTSGTTYDIRGEILEVWMEGRSLSLKAARVGTAIG